MDKYSSSRILLRFLLPLLAFLQLTSAATSYSSGNGTYRTNFCLCQLDIFLLKVRQKLHANEQPPPTPQITTATTSVTTETASVTTTTAAAAVTTATQPPSTTTTISTGTTGDISSTTATASTTTTAAVGRKKRAAVAVTASQPLKETRDYPLGLITPTFGIVFDSSVKLVDDFGVLYNDSYQVANCSCKTESVVQVGLCLESAKFVSDYNDMKSDASRNIISQLLPLLDSLLIEGFKSKKQYIRILPTKFSDFNGKAKIHFTVNLNAALYQPDYYVDSILKPNLEGSFGGKLFGGFLINIGENGCYEVTDVTLPVPRTATLMDQLRFLFIPAALAVFALLVCCTCFGKRNKFYVRFW